MSSTRTAKPDREGAEPLAPLLARIWRDYLRRRRAPLILALLCAGAYAVLTGVLAWLLNPAVHYLFPAKGAVTAGIVTLKPPLPGDLSRLSLDSAWLLWLIPLAIVVVGSLRGLAAAIQATTTNRIGHRLVGDIQVQLFGKLVRADLARLRTEHTGAYVSSVLYDANLMREGATTGVVTFVREFLTVISCVVVMASQDWMLTLAVVLFGPLASGVMQRFSKRVRKAARGAMTETSALSSAIMESLDGVRIVKIENREGYEEQRVAEVVERRQSHVIKGANARALAAPVTETLTTVIIAVVIAYAGWRARTSGMGVGQFMTFLAALGAAGQSLRQVANLQAVMSEGLTAARRLFSALDIEPEVREAPGAPQLAGERDLIRFEDVRFDYGPGASALSGVSLHAGPGETVALVGPSGGGKSTILSLIPRFYDVTGGKVSINGADVRDLSITSLRSHIALVTQEPFLFDDTIRANIAYAKPDATPAEIEQAARAAAAHEFIETLPHGYDTSVGEAGARLSGGQRQRIAIARAFLKDAPILLLDEATSALDTESEAKVQVALERLMRGRTTLLIAHRLSTVRGADRIYVVEGGRIVEEGDHDSLMAAGGLYARLARTQNLEESPTAVLKAIS
jgi:subfamily B ATP-binding cassette protein MsbA